MSLFTVSRYTGDQDDSPKKKKTAEASAILQKLRDEAKARRQSSAGTDKQTNQVDEQTKHTQDHLNHSQDSVAESTEKEPLAKKAKKRERQSEDVSEKTKSPKKRKQSKSDFVETEAIKEEIVLSEGTQNGSAKEHLVDKHKITEEVGVAENESDVRKARKKEKGKRKDKKSKSKDVSQENDVIKDDLETVEAEDDEGSQSDAGDKAAEDEATIVDTGPGSQEIGGFTVIGNVKPAQTEKVMRVLPDWLSSPAVLSADLKQGLMPVGEMPGLDSDLVKAVINNGIKTFFPVQSQVIPALLTSSATGFLYGRAGYRPSDICVSAPTGSGKTLAFVLPIVQALKPRVGCEVRALAVLPVRDLAVQVFKVFEEYCKNTKLKVGNLTGQKLFAAEQKSLVKKTLRGYRSMYDIIVATPGRLVDHLNKTKGFNLGHLRYLVIDEADRMMDEIKQEWLTQTEAAVYRSGAPPTSLNPANSAVPQTPVQKLLYSATLSQNPEKLQPLNLFQPKLFISADSGETQTSLEKIAQKLDSTSTAGNESTSQKNKPKESILLSKDDLGKYTTPAELSEFVVETTPQRKPLLVLHMLHQLGYRHILCFTNSVEATHRLSTLIKLYGGIEVAEISSSYQLGRRNKIIQKFVSGNIDILICSDVVARGMDIANVKYVVSYDPPKFIQTHIHRIGRTARAGKEGVAINLLEDKECFHFKKILRQAGKKFPKKMVITKKDLNPLLPKYKKALSKLPAALEAKSGDIEKDTVEDTVDEKQEKAKRNSKLDDTVEDVGDKPKKAKRDARLDDTVEELKGDQHSVSEEEEMEVQNDEKDSDAEQESIEESGSKLAHKKKKKKRSKKKS